jgi:hypothetical protein
VPAIIDFMSKKSYVNENFNIKNVSFAVNIREDCEDFDF